MAEKHSTIFLFLLASFAVVLTVPTEGKYDISFGKENQRDASKALQRFRRMPLDKIGGGVVLRELQEEPYADTHQKTQNDVSKRSYRVFRGMPLDKIGGGVVLRELSEQPKTEQNKDVGSENLIGNSRRKRRDVNGLGILQKTFEEIDPYKFSNFKKRNFNIIDQADMDKRNFDEIDRAGFRSMGKRNFDEIDRAGFRSMGKRNFDEIDRAGFRSMGKRNFDEIDRNGFQSMGKRNFDEIDRAGFRSMGKRNFDEIDRAGFHNLGKKNFDEIDRSGFSNIGKRILDKTHTLEFNPIDQRTFGNPEISLPIIDKLLFSNAENNHQGMTSKETGIENDNSIGKIYGLHLNEEGKRNFDEIDRAGFNHIGKRNVDDKAAKVPLIKDYSSQVSENKKYGPDSIYNVANNAIGSFVKSTSPKGAKISSTT